jgi:hypothetical protein
MPEERRTKENIPKRSSHRESRRRKRDLKEKELEG